MVRHFRFVPLCVLLALPLGVIAATGASEIWLSGVSPFVRQKMFQESESDYLELFKPDAPWTKSAAVVKVFMINGIALAIEMGLLSGKDSAGRQACGVGVEGFAAPDNAKVVANRIKKNGGELAYVAMDEPLWYGHHYFMGKNACQWSMEDVARDTVQGVADLREKFPDVQIGDVEPIGTAQPDWVQEIAQWTLVYHKVVGQQLAFFHADVAWNSPWQEQLPSIKKSIQSVGMKFGIIYDGGGSAAESDDVWTREAEQRFRMVESNPSMVPDRAIIQTWSRWPKKILPEDQPGTLTNLVLRYTKLR